MLKIVAIPALADNYIWMIHSPVEHSRVLLVDPGDAQPAMKRLRQDSLELAGIIITHHHPDHTGGVPELVEQWSCPVYGPAGEAAAVVTEPRADGELVQRPDLGLEFQAIAIPGHTLAHTAFYGHEALFCGDTLFSIGCGRLFEGTPEQMSDSLSRLAALPEASRVYAGHEYTLANLRFAAAVEPGNPEAEEYRRWCETERSANRPTLPSNIGREKRLNPFLRSAEDSIREAAEKWSGEPLGDKVRVFAALRRWKDEF